jgi:hypothetical protein
MASRSDRRLRYRLRAAGVLVAVAAFASSPAQPALAAAPGAVTFAGTFQNENGCASDWDPGCSYTGLTYDANDDAWQRVLTIPAGSYEYKAALNNTWDENYGERAVPNGNNIGLSTASPGAVKFYYDDKTHWATDNVGSTIVTVPGSFQSELGCSGDWDPGCLRSWLQDTDDDDIYTFTTSALPAGSYEMKAAVNETWDVNYGAGGTFNGANIGFTVHRSYAPLTLRFVATTHVLSVVSTAPNCAQAAFPDVPANHAFCPEIAWAKTSNVAEGFADGGFHPSAEVTRQAMAAFLTRIAGAAPAACTQAPFSDVPKTHPFCAEIAYAKSRGWTTGFSDGTYRPGASITRQAMAAFLLRVTGFSPSSCATTPFTDVPISNTFCAAIQWDKLNGVVNGFGDGTYRPSATVTRQAMAAFLYRVALVRGNL